MIRVMSIVGARPQFIKAAPVSVALKAAGIDESIIHTGQHYDAAMSEIFFAELGIPSPAVNLGVGSGSHGRQTAEMLAALEALMLGRKPDVVLVFGDTNSTLAGALAAVKLGIRIAHVEAGLRSFNRAMPEEINRILTDQCSDLLLCPSETALRNLAVEGITRGVHLVGDTMYDALLTFAPLAQQRSKLIEQLGLAGKRFYLATIHRPYNADDRQALASVIEAFSRLELPIVFPIHPRTRNRLATLDLGLPANVLAVEPIGYLDMLAMLDAAEVVITDSGGLQKEACFAGTPCVTLRPETEWVETIAAGWNRLAWGSSDAILLALEAGVAAKPAEKFAAYGNGDAAQKIAALILRDGSTT